MSAVDAKHVAKDCTTSCSVNKSEQNNGKRSFIITVDDKGKVEVSPSDQGQPKRNQQCQRKSNKLRAGKQRIRIALVEEEDGVGSDGELDNDSNETDMISLDAQSLETMHDRFVKIYNKNLRGKPSFVVLEDALVRKRMEETLQGPCGRNICHIHAEQQTSPCDIGAHTGCQTDEFLLQCAVHPNRAQSRGCQATDISYKLNECGICHGVPMTRKSSSTESPLRRLSQMCAAQLANKLKQQINSQATAAAATVAPNTVAVTRSSPELTPHVTISFLPATTTVNPQVVLPQPQQQQQQQSLTAATFPHSNYANCCTNMQPAASYNNCSMQMPAATNSPYCQPANNGSYCCFLKQQQQQLKQQQLQQQQQQQLQQLQQQPHLIHSQQQHSGAAASFGCNSCCMLRPAMAQSTVCFNQAPLGANHCHCHPMLLTPDSCSLQQPQEYPLTGWTPPSFNQCLCYSMPTVSMSAFDIPHCPNCHMQQHGCGRSYSDLPQQQQQQQQKYLPGSPELESASQMRVQREGCAKKQESLVERQPKEPDQHVELPSSVSQVTVRRLNAPTANEKKAKKLAIQHSRNKAGTSHQATKLYMARFGRTCLILKPTSTAMPQRLLAKRISRYTSVVATQNDE